jgi:hypothetical protein
MQRDMDTVREILREISDTPGNPDQGVLVKGKSPEETQKILYHVALLNEAGLLTGQALDGMGMENPIWIDLDLTWQGHEFLDNVRDPDIWRKTKERAAPVAGAALGVLVEIAKAEIKRKLGLP